MNFIRGIFFGLVQIIELPVNLILELWRLPGRGRGLLFGFPSIFVLILTLLAIGWAKYGSNQDLIDEYWRQHALDRVRLTKLNEEIGTDVGAKSTLGDDEATEDAKKKSKAKEMTLREQLEQVIQREVFIPASLKVTGNPRTVVRVTLDAEKNFEQVEITSPSAVDAWDDTVVKAIRKTEAFAQLHQNEATSSSLELDFGWLETQREKLLYSMSIGLRKLIDLSPSNPEYKFEFGLLSQEMGNNTQARMMMDQVAPADRPGLCKGHVWQARNIWKDNLATEPISSLQNRCLIHLRNALTADPTDIEANEGMGELYFSMGNLIEAEKYYRIVWERQLSSTIRLVAIYEQLGNTVKQNEILAKTKNRLEDALAKEPNELTYVFDIERVYLMQAHIFEVQALVLERQGQSNDAQRALQEAKKIIQEAIGLLEKYLTDATKDRINPRLARIYVGIATAEAQKNDNKFTLEGFNYAKKALEHVPNLDEALWILTVIGNQEDCSFAKDAVAIYDPVQKRSEAPALVLREYANYLIRQKKNDEAIEWLEAAYERFKDDPVTGNNLAYLLITANPPNPERALTIIDKVIEDTASWAHAELRSQLYDTKASALMALQRHVDAIPYLEASLQYRGNHRPTMEALRDCYSAIGQKEVADFYQRKIDSLPPESTSKQ